VTTRKPPQWRLGTGDASPPPGGMPSGANGDQPDPLTQLMSLDAGPRMITAAMVNVAPLDADARRDLLGRCGLRPSVLLVSNLYARLDSAAERGRDNTIEREFLSTVGGDVAADVAKAVASANKLMPPATLTQLTREIIEWCCDATGAGSDSGTAEAPSMTPEELLLLVLSINSEHDANPNFSSDSPTAEELQKYHDELAADPEKLWQEARRQMLWEFARLQANAVTLPVLVLGETYETWFKGWPSVAPYDLIGDTPVDAFAAATGVPLRDFVRLGLRLHDDSRRGDAMFTKSSLLAAGVDLDAVSRMEKVASLPIAEYRKRLAAERKKGDLMHRRYTFGERPILQLGDDKFVVLRPAWVLDRFCGPQLYWEAFWNFGAEKDSCGEQFSQGMNYVFERNVDYSLRRVTKRAAGALTLINESQMQTAWKTGGNTPSTCDWVLVDGRFCLLIEATNHWLDARLAQGFADAADYETDVDDTFVNRKFEQIKSTVELLDEKGWEGCTFDDNTIFVPLVAVPNAGIPATTLLDFDMRLRAHPVLGTLGKYVVAPGILTRYELQVIEGICEHRAPASFVKLLAEWRFRCTTSFPIQPQTFFDLKGYDRPLGSFPTIAHALLMKTL
jgi:hypothetical protein